MECQKFATHAPPLGTLPRADERHSWHGVGAHAAGHQIDWILIFGERLQGREQFFASRSDHSQTMFQVVPTCRYRVGDVADGDVMLRLSGNMQVIVRDLGGLLSCDLKEGVAMAFPRGPQSTSST